MLEQVTPVIITFNEAANIARTLEKLRWARDIVVVDSFSDDQTLEIVSNFPRTRVFQRKFDDFASQCNYALAETGIRTDWVLNLDADYVLTDEFINELKGLKESSDIAGYRSRFIYCVNGKQIRSGIYPSVTVLFRKPNANFVADGHAHRVVVNGPIANLSAPILHDDRKSLRRWLSSQIHYTELEAKKLRLAEPSSLGWTDRIRRWRIVAPPAMLFYCLIVRGGLLDGWAGFYYAFQRVLAELMLSLYLFERREPIVTLGSAELEKDEFVEPQTKTLTT